jgi:hypothetical protein
LDSAGKVSHGFLFVFAIDMQTFESRRESMKYTIIRFENNRYFERDTSGFLASE